MQNRGIFRNKKMLSLTRTVLSMLFWLMAWQLGAAAVGSALLLPSPFAVLSRLWVLMGERVFYEILAHSVGRIGLGFLLGGAIGSLCGIFMFVSPTFRTIMAIPLSGIKAAPVASFVILALIWIPSGQLSIFIAFLMVMPLFAQNLLLGLSGIDHKILEMAKVFRIPLSRQLQQIYLPYLRPFLLSAIRLGIGMGWKAGIAGEVLAIPFGSIGTQLYNAKVYLETTDLFAWTIIIVGLSLLLELVAVRLIGGAKVD